MIIAPLTIGLPAQQLITLLPSRGIVAWMLYHQRWLNALDFAHKCRQASYQHKGRPWNRCEEKGLWENMCARVVVNLGANPQSLRDLDKVFKESEELTADSCHVCKASLRRWRADVCYEVEMLPKFSIFVG